MCQKYSILLADFYYFRENVWVKIFWWFNVGGKDDHWEHECLHLICLYKVVLQKHDLE